MATPNNSGEVVVNSSVDQMLENLPVGSIARALGNNMFGVNFRQTGNAVPRAKDSYGYTFFTKPQLNLSTINVTNYRGFYNLLTSNEASYQRYTRLTLDSRLTRNPSNLKSPFVDPYNAFIPILTNNLVSMSGWPDLAAPVYTSDTGPYGEEHSFVDGVTNHYEAFDIDATFKNTKGNPLLYFFYTWIKYETLVFEGILNPYLDMITENEIDYNTRIYRLVMDETKRYVTYIGSTGASFPVNVPTGSLFDYNIDTPFNTKNSEINIRFRSIGFISFEDYLKLEFNRTMAIFNADIWKILQHDLGKASAENKERADGTKVYNGPGGSSYVKIPHYMLRSPEGNLITHELHSLNHRAYPYINLATNELEWWTSAANFKAATS